MAFRFTATRPMRLAVTLLIVCCVSGARAEDDDAAAVAAATCGDAVADATRARRAEQARRRRRQHAARRRTASPAAGFHHQADAGAARAHAQLHRDRRLDPDFRRQGRAAGRYRLHLLPARRRRPRQPAGDVPVQWRAGRVLGLAAVRRCRAMAVVDQRRRRGVVRFARSVAQRRDLARLHRSRLHRSRRHRLQPLRRLRRGRAQAVLLRRRRRQFDRAGDPALAGKIRSPAVAEIRRRRKLWRHPRTEDRAQSADPAGRRRARADPGFAGARLPRLFRLEPAAILSQPADHGGGGARSQGTR